VVFFEKFAYHHFLTPKAKPILRGYLGSTIYIGKIGLILAINRFLNVDNAWY
jgi:hypothetical protein